MLCKMHLSTSSPAGHSLYPHVLACLHTVLPGGLPCNVGNSCWRMRARRSDRHHTMPNGSCARQYPTAKWRCVHKLQEFVTVTAIQRKAVATHVWNWALRDIILLLGWRMTESCSGAESPDTGEQTRTTWKTSDTRRRAARQEPPLGWRKTKLCGGVRRSGTGKQSKKTCAASSARRRAARQELTLGWRPFRQYYAVLSKA